MNTRVRFAPSPTGFLHVGSARTALYNYLYARSVGGTFVLRIEDTDAERSQQELIDQILRTLEWLGIEWDEGPLRQSELRSRHEEAVASLIEGGFTYEDDGAIRFRIPTDGPIVVDDVVRGRVEWEPENVRDPVIRRSDGSPTFVLANAVDDIDMGITHAIRGEDLLATVPVVVSIMRALGSPADLTYAHLPLLVNEARKKLSKRRDDVAIEDYRGRGYLPDAMTNYLALLGWGPPDEIEIRPLSEIISLFRLEDVNPSPAFFDVKKLEHINGEYIRALSVPDFVSLAQPYLDDSWTDPGPLTEMAPHLQQRCPVLAAVHDLIDWAYLEDPPEDADSWAKVMPKAPVDYFDAVIAALESATWEPEALSEVVFGVGETHELNKRKSQAPVRVGALGRNVGPPLWESLVVLGRDETLRRLRNARARL